MSLGEHLEELRSVLIRSLLALLATCLLSIPLARYLLDVIARPVILVLRRHGQPENLLATGPAETLLIYIKVVVFSGVVVAAPYILKQLWDFVAAGLYPHERRWVYKLVPMSVGLFFVGVAFMYTLVLLVSLNFLVGFSGWIPLPKAQPNAYERMMLDMPAPRPLATQPGVLDIPGVRFVTEDPAAPAPGQLWFNVYENKLKLRGGDDTYSVQLVPEKSRGLVTTHFRIGEYLSFVLIMTIAFGLAFQTPLVVVFLVRSGLVPVETFRRYRKIVILVVILLAGMISPPDLFSHLLLSGPMVLLFELGLFIAARGGHPDRSPAGT